MQDIIDQFNHGDKEAAISAAVHLIDEQPDEPGNYALLATMLINMRAYDQADELLVKALGLFPDQEELRYNWGLSAYQQGNYQNALARLLPLTKPDIAKGLRADASYMVALTYKAADDNLHALAFAMTASQLNPQASDAAVLTANLLLALGSLQEAKQLLEPFLDSQDGQVQLTYGMILSALGEDGSAYLEAAKNESPDAYARARELVQFLKQQDGDDHD
ncbi:tetratricopeptide repeat protein [Lacticaseibacillus songhuajiangensis]|jgi:Flp pilus assembly protein TadD|uniref:tetratricopeptide repeat protein n=1 Tax=Lacticaseibacillus songhuajiangensis TaxID=1296539 RepID=UPI000F76EA23|nr:tetratricopeptide repeat protein [Lacticaseibacillus songhuajiangensis]